MFLAGEMFPLRPEEVISQHRQQPGRTPYDASYTSIIKLRLPTAGGNRILSTGRLPPR
jgi:hypothetical protein